jgi:hypothetical protein
LQVNLEQTILRNILTDEKYMRKVLPFIKPEYFEGIYRTLFKETGKFVAKYNKLPTSTSFKIELDQTDKLSSEQHNMAMDVLPHIFSDEKVDEQM